MSKCHTHLTYAVSFEVKSARQSTDSEVTMQVITKIKRSATNINMQESRIMQLSLRSNGKENEISTENKKISKLIAYISYRSCKDYQHGSAILHQNLTSMAENSSVHGSKFIQLTPN